MKLIIFLALNLLLLTLVNALASDSKSLTLMRTGRDVDGIIIYDRIEIMPDLQVVWKTASNGAKCPSEAGTYVGQITKEKFDEIFKLALAVEADKAIVPDGAKVERDSREASNSMVLENDGKIRTIKIAGFPESVAALHEELAFVRTKLTPQTGVRMQAAKIAQGVRVTFTHLGNIPFRLLVPKEASEAFYMQNRSQVKFKTAPGTRNVMLSKDLVSKSYDIQSPLKKGDKYFIFYSGAALAHHGDAGPDGKLPAAQEVALCAEF